MVSPLVTTPPNALVMFTRYPKAGQAKTRLIPHLGATAAASLQRRMTEHIVETIRPLHKRRTLSLEIQFTGGTLAEMQAWLGKDWRYQPQSKGNLGQRLTTAFDRHFDQQFQRVVAIGADCPAIAADHVCQAFDALQTQDVVLGPAHDGGYYLVGLRQSRPALFDGIAWGTPQVFEQTIAISDRLNLSVATLETLRDIDRPEDLLLLQNSLLAGNPPQVLSP